MINILFMILIKAINELSNFISKKLTKLMNNETFKKDKNNFIKNLFSYHCKLEYIQKNIGQKSLKIDFIEKFVNNKFFFNSNLKIKFLNLEILIHFNILF